MWHSQVHLFVKVPLGSSSSSAKMSLSARRVLLGHQTPPGLSLWVSALRQVGLPDETGGARSYVENATDSLLLQNVGFFYQGEKAPSWNRVRPQQARALEDQLN